MARLLAATLTRAVADPARGTVQHHGVAYALWRPARALLTATIALVVFARSAFAQPRTEYLAKQLRTSDDYRVRTQAALALGAGDEDAAVAPLCEALGRDANEAVRAAAAAALGKLGRPEGLPCLERRASAEPSGSVKAQIAKSARRISDTVSGGDPTRLPPDARIYVAIGVTNNKTDRSADEIDAIVREAMTKRLRSTPGYAVAPRSEQLAAGKKIVEGRRLKGYFLQATVDAPRYQAGSLTIVVHVVMSGYPGKNIKGEAAPRLTQQDTPASDRASEDALIRMAVERALDSFQQRIVAADMLAPPRPASMPSIAPSSAPPSSLSHHRRMRNYLLDPHFQLKYTGYLVAVALVLSVALGTLLWRTSKAVLAQNRAAVAQGLETVRRGQELVRESQKVTDVVKMNIEHAYSDQPELAAVFNDSAERDAARLAGEQHRLESDAARLSQQALDLEVHQRRTLVELIAALSALVVLIGAVGIVLTHKVAGPLHKMKRQIRELGEGHLRPPGSLRRGDELVEFHATFDRTVRTLRERQSAEIRRLDTVIATLRAAPDGIDDALRSLDALRDEMQRELE